MFELGIFCVIFLAVSYWAFLWLMGRREDVLHGEFVEDDLHPDEPARSTIPEQPVRPTLPEQPAFQSERLETLLNAIKQDLNQLVRK
jgi:hypothetical protein